MKNVNTKFEHPNTKLSEEYIDSNLHFSTQLFKEVVSQHKGKNILISPTSIYLALCMTANGADGKTKTAMEQVLGRNKLKIEDINQNSCALMNDLIQERESTTLNIANSIRYRNEFNPNMSFLTTNAKYFNAHAYKINFNNKKSVDAINKWVDISTNQLINEIIDEINPNSVMYLINTLYFNARWHLPFE